VGWLLIAGCWASSGFAEGWPSLFRGVMVADSPVGIRVVSVEEGSLAHQADLRPEDVVVQIDGTPIKTIDEFAVMSKALKGRAARADVVVLRNGQPRQLVLQIYSAALLREWDIPFVPDYDLRFIDPNAAVAYWTNLGRGYETAGDLEHALNAHLNALHHVPDSTELALKVSSLWSALAQRQLQNNQMPQALAVIERQMRLMARLFDRQVDDATLAAVKQQLETTVRALKQRQSR